MKTATWSVPVALLACVLAAACQRTAEAPAGSEAAAAPAATPDAEQPDAAPTATAQATPPPTLEVETIDGKAYDLAEHRGKWVVVNFWATWCAPCIKEMPELSALDAMREHVEVIGLAYEDIDPAGIRAFLEEHPVVYPIAVVDVYDPPADFATPRGLPMTYLIAPDGRVARQFLGPVTALEIEQAIAAAGGPAVDA